MNDQEKTKEESESADISEAVRILREISVDIKKGMDAISYACKVQVEMLEAASKNQKMAAEAMAKIKQHADAGPPSANVAPY